jgi:hypothetical protein
MLTGLSGALVSEHFVETALERMFAGQLGEATCDAARRELLRWRGRQAAGLGPVSSARAVYDSAAVPLARTLGFEPAIEAAASDGALVFSRLGPGAGVPVLLTSAWGHPLDAAWRAAVPLVVASGAAWCLCTNGRALRLVDARRALARSFLEFDLEPAIDDEASFRVLWALLRRDSFAPPPLVDRVVHASSRHTVGVCQSLRHGVVRAIGELLAAFSRDRGHAPANAPPDRGHKAAGASPDRGHKASALCGSLDTAYEQALTIVYRLLFLLFAESRGLVPLWHPVYRESYSVEALRDLAERPGAARGLWEALQAMSRLAHAGCRAGSLRVTPFNGRLFSPSATPLGETRAVDDEAARRLVLALSTLPGRGTCGRARIVYRDLGVEQLGAVYESVLDYRPRHDRAAGVALVRGRGARKSSGTFYTPRSITTYLVRTTLGPLVADAPAERILSLRVLDPAMGSGAFLVAACRFLARAYESALVDHGGIHPSDISDDDRRGFRRLVAQRCLYGVDRNHVAVQLARLSLWLCTLAPERPLTFLDHHLVVGDSLVGASLDDIRRPPPGAPGGGPRPVRDRAALPLFEDEGAGPALRAVLPARLRVALLPDDSLAVVREKERTLSALASEGSPLAAWKAVADLWCSLAFRRRCGRSDTGIFFAVADAVLRGRSSLPDHVVGAWLADARASAATRRFFHWPLEFPEVFFGEDGTPRADAGFDAVVGNPPWDMVRGDNGEDASAGRARLDEPGCGADARLEARQLLRFSRTSGLYRWQGDGHENLFQLFVERSFRLARDGGRLGLVVPWGLAADRGSAGLRRLLLDHCRTDQIVGFENSKGLFPIHRSVRFLLFTASTGGRTRALPCRLGFRDASPLEQGVGDEPVVIPRRLLDELSPGDLSLPDIRSAIDLSLLEKVTRSAPALGSKEGWGVEFGRELNATDDAGRFVRGGSGLPVLEGKHVVPFAVTIPRDVRRLPTRSAEALLNRLRWDRPRVAYRDVASATNRLTLIAAVVPAGVVTVHTLFCLKTPLGIRDQAFLCGVLNSFVANYLVRLRVTTHVTAGIVSRLPVPRSPATSPLRRRITALSLRLQRSAAPEQSPEYARMQAAVARLYELTADEFAHVLATFPLCEALMRARAIEEFARTG